MSNEKMREALRSIANSTCCGRCQEAALVARAALGAQRQAEPVDSAADEVTDAQRWKFMEQASGDVTFRIHNSRPDQRRAAIDAAMQKDTQ